MTLTERFDALPEEAQRQLIRIARAAASMSSTEKEVSQIWLANVAVAGAQYLQDDLVLAADMLGACMGVINELDKASGEQASPLGRG